MMADLKSMSRKELEKLLFDTKKALAAAQARDRRDARKAAEKAAAEFGFSLAELEGGEKPAKSAKKAKPAKPKSKAKFANPADASQTWTGKGRQPNWYRDAVAKGVAPEDMAI
ncbi:H-NS family nucleoid-associated regulatory protein [Sulfitobacter sabulilitoris]|uniref:H-NS histone family protein n=1 Tax=Sulfitobacter sabulilitoris TaxID=2562655 RepID=A0A5S3PCN0_9RHOB|nr:H-NS histone family protein [Sulfitobacter sabulilitoris]TMM51613.1 H-NS histone family protein [Sulfitobacter sabulilitoris]